MSVTAEALRLHLRYSDWATRRLIDATASLSEDEWHRDFQTADKSVLGTMVHIFAADRLWFCRFQGAARKEYVSDADRSPEALRRQWPAVHAGWLNWGSELTDEGALKVLDYQDLRGRPWRQPIWQLVLHVVNHATHHRGQVSGFLRAMGYTPPVLDLVQFYREL